MLLRVCMLLSAVVLPASGVAQSRHPAESLPLDTAPAVVRSQPLATGAVTHQVQVRTAEGEPAVTVRSIQPDSIVGNYHIDFSALDVDADGYISREEAQANPALADEFNALDTLRRGQLDRNQLAGWLMD